MGSLRVLSGADVVDILKANGFAKVRQSGSHVSMQLSAAETTITVIVPLHKELAIGTLKSIIRMSGLERRLFEVA